MTLNLQISNNRKFRLEFNGKGHKFSMCRFVYVEKMCHNQIYEDYLYIFVENMLGRLKKIPKINQNHLFGKVGKWQEYFYFEASYTEKYSSEIEIMEKAVFISAEKYGIFLYEFDNKVWIEMNKGYEAGNGLTPTEYYGHSHNYQILLAPLSKYILSDWTVKLEKIKKQWN